MSERGTSVALVCAAHDRQLDGVADYTYRLRQALEPHGVTAEIVDAADIGRLRGYEGDVVHVQYSPALLGRSPRLRRLPSAVPRSAALVTTLHEYGDTRSRRRDRLARPFERRRVWDHETGWLVPRSGRLLVTNDRHARLVRDRFAGRVVPEVVPVPPNVEPAVPGGDVRARVRTRLHVPADAPLLVFFGFVHPVKGIRYLLEALPTLRADRPSLHLVVTGATHSLALPEDEARQVDDELRGRARELGQQDAVTWTGYLPEREVSELLAAADAAVLPFTAGLTTKSGALAAVFAHGLPVVGTVAPTPDPALAPDRDAVLVPPRDPRALADGVNRLLADPALAASLRQAGLRHAKERSWQHAGAEHARIYQDVVGAARGDATARRRKAR